MEANEKLEMLLEYSGMKILPFSKEVGQGSQTFYDIRSGKIQSFTNDVANKIVDAFPEINKEWLIGNDANMLKKRASPFEEPFTTEPKPDNKSDDLKQLEKIKSQNGKSKNSNEGKVLKNDDVVKIKTFIIPIKGFAGLKNAFYDDQYITENFDETTTEVPHYLYSPISYRIQSTGNSMPKSIPDGSWVTGVPVPEMMWLTYKFKQDKIYILFHPYRGILFKNVKNLSEYEIMLCSENEDKEEYPDEKFKINEFRKILLAIKVERFI